MARILAAVALSSTVLAIAPPASAATNGIRLFFSAPFVQGPSYSGTGFALEDFEGFTAAEGTGCLGSSAVGTISNFCSARPGDGAGGAIVSTDVPTVNGSASHYAAVPWASNEHIEITFAEPVQYIGLWWSAGNVASAPGAITNYVEFYHGDQLLTTMTADRVMEMLGGSVPNPYPGTDVLTAEDGGTYPIGYYYGDPTGHTSLTPSSKSPDTSDYPFVYLNLFTKGATRVDRIVIGGWGFEFDNLATSTGEQLPTADMVFVDEYLDEVTDPGATDGASGGGEKNLAKTGFDGGEPTGFALVALAAGAALIVVRRRTRAHH
jgi:hypothetical protein